MSPEEKEWYYDANLTIGVVAKKLNVTVQTVRFYEQEGLVLSEKNAAGHRLFSLHDLERLQCIRRMIMEHGLNVQGIKRLMSLVPCWEMKGGLDNDCRNCPAYYEATAPCWHLRKVGEKCTNADCRACPVYRTEFNCQKLKQVIYNRKENKETTTKAGIA